MSTLRPNWRLSYGPLDMKMPDDGTRPLMTIPGPHEDSQDCITATGTHGPLDVGAPGGSGIVFGHSVQEPENVIALDDAVLKRSQPYDWEHHIRNIRYAIARTAMVRDTQGPRHVLLWADRARAHWSETGPTTNDPSNVKENVAQYLQMARANPHHGVTLNARALGWVMFGEAAALKVDSRRSKSFALACLDLCETGAFIGTGQLVIDTREGVDGGGLTYCMHESIKAIGALALAHRLQLPTPYWAQNWALSLAYLPIVQYYGVNSMPAFVRTVDGRLEVCTGLGQQPDPATGHWTSLCAVLKKTTGSDAWLERSWRFGAQTVWDDQSRRDTMMIRGYR